MSRNMSVCMMTFLLKKSISIVKNMTRRLRRLMPNVICMLNNLMNPGKISGLISSITNKGNMETKSFTNGRYRIIASPFQGTEHIFGKVVSIGCAMGNCPLCKYFKPNIYWLLGCINRSDNTYHIYKFYYEYFKQIQMFATNSDIGDPTTYDIEIQDGKVFALPKTPLSAADKLIQEHIDKDVLKQMTTPWSIERVNEVYERFKEKLAALL